jgi:site-specific DNA-methyltransferase (adenine-specific)
MSWDNAPASMVHINAMLRLAVPTIIWGGNYFPLPPAKCILCWDKVQPEDFSLAMCEYAWTNIDKPSKLFRRRVVGYDRQHPTQKPIELMAWCLSHLPQSAGAILDPFAGSLTTVIACIQAGRPCIAIEREASYFWDGVERVDAELNRAPLFEPAPVIQRSLLEERS